MNVTPFESLEGARRALERGDAARAGLRSRARTVLQQARGFAETGNYPRVLPEAAARALAADPTGATRVLVAEDDAAYASWLARHIRRELPGVEVVVAGSVADAGRALDAGPVHAVVADVDLGDGLGVEVVERARAMNPDVGCIVMSGVVSETLAAVAARARAAAFDKASQDPRVLLETLRRLVSLQRCAAEPAAAAR